MIGVAFDLRLRIELAGGEVAAPLNGPVVSHLDNPRAGGTLRAVEDAALPLDEDEQVLDEIVSFRGISEDADSNTASDSYVSLEEDPQSLRITLQDADQQVFICECDTRRFKIRFLAVAPFGQGQRWEPCCSEGTQCSPTRKKRNRYSKNRERSGP